MATQRSKPLRIDLDQPIARAFVKDMKAYFAETKRWQAGRDRSAQCSLLKHVTDKLRLPILSGCPFICAIISQYRIGAT